MTVLIECEVTRKIVCIVDFSTVKGHEWATLRTSVI